MYYDNHPGPQPPGSYLVRTPKLKWRIQESNLGLAISARQIVLPLHQFSPRNVRGIGCDARVQGFPTAGYQEFLTGT
eukprot:2552768-Rhodomonas_salina.1